MLGPQRRHAEAFDILRETADQDCRKSNTTLEQLKAKGEIRGSNANLTWIQLGVRQLRDRDRDTAAEATPIQDQKTDVCHRHPVLPGRCSVRYEL